MFEEINLADDPSDGLGRFEQLGQNNACFSRLDPHHIIHYLITLAIPFHIHR